MELINTASPRGMSPSFSDRFKRRFLGEPLTSEHLESERLSNPVALGALSPDAISSTAYGPEQIMVELLPYAGVAAFTLLLPIIGVIAVILVFVTLTYRGVVTAYTRAGGSYMVARDNFGPRVAQIAAAALLIDYVVTCAVQPAAGTVAVVSAIPALRPYHLEITIGVLVADLFCQPARIAAVRPVVFYRDLLVRGDDLGDDRDGYRAGTLLGIAAISSGAHRRSSSGPSWWRSGDGCHDPDCVARVCQRRHVADRGGSDFQHRQRLS